LCKSLSKKYLLKISQILCLFSLVTAALAGVDVLKTKVRRISEVLFDGFLRSTSDIFPHLLVSVSLSWPPKRCFFSPSTADQPKTRVFLSFLTEASSKLIFLAITPLAGALSPHTPISRSQWRRWVVFLQTWQTCRDRRRQLSHPSSQRAPPPPSYHPRSLAA